MGMQVRMYWRGRVKVKEGEARGHLIMYFLALCHQ